MKPTIQPCRLLCGLFLILVLLLTVSPAPASAPAPDLESIRLPESYRDSSTMARVQYLSGQGYAFSASAPDSALLYFRQAEVEARDGRDSAALLKTVFDLGHFMMSRGIFERALEYMFTGEQLAAAQRDTSKQIFFIYWKSRVYNELGEYAKSLQACEEAMRVDNDSDGRAWAYNYYGEALRGNGQLERARDTLLRSLELFKQSKERIGILMVAAKLAHVYQQLKQPEEARVYAAMVLERWERVGAYESFLTAWTSLVDLHIDAGELDSAERKAVNALNTVEGKKYYRPMIDLAEKLASVYERRGDFENALKYTRMATDLRNEYQLDRVKINLAVRDSEYLNERLQAQNVLLREQRKGQLYLSVGLGALLLLLLIIAFILIRANRRARKFNRILHRKNTALDEKNARLDELNQEKDMLMQIVAHDLKSPLNSVQGLSEMLRGSGELNDMQRQVLDKMGGVVDRGIDLIRNLLELSALENGKLEARPEYAELTGILKKITGEFRPRAEKKSIDLHLDLPAEPVLLHTDPRHFERIVDNLVSNAIKYSPRGKRVWVELKQREGRLYTVIRDEGPGIGEEDRKKMFGKFQRLSARPTGGESSNGLGLAIVKSFAEQLGGEIEVNSRVGEGAEFVLALPVSAQ